MVLIRKVLIISYAFPPWETIGSLRPFGLAKYLPEWGWEPTVLTAEYSNRPIYPFTVIETPKYDQLETVKKLFGYNPIQSNGKNNFKPLIHKYKINALTIIGSPLAEIVNYPDAQKGWYKNAFEAGSTLLRNNKFDAIISTSSPVTPHIVAKDLAHSFNLPWIADLRDLWTQFHNYPYSNIRRVFERQLEKKVLGCASALVTVSQPLKEKLQQLHEHKSVFSIPNGFDPDNQGMGYPQQQDGFTIVYTGNIHKVKQNPTPLFKALRTLSDQRTLDLSDVRVNFFGCDYSWLNKSIYRSNFKDIIRTYSKVPHEESLKIQQEAQILLLLTWNDPAEKGVYTGKVFEYLNAKRPILSMGTTDGGVVRELLDQTQAGVQVSNVEELKEYLIKAYREYKENGTVHYRGIDMEITKYSHVEMARKYVEVLEEICDSK